ncbi:MAG: YCF48-related protein [bacterium]
MYKFNSLKVFLISMLSAAPLTAQWVSQHSTDRSLQSMQMFASGVGYVVGENGIVFRLSNFGSSPWKALTTPPVPPPPFSFYDVCFLNENEGWVVGDESRIFITTNMGEHWDPPQTNLPLTSPVTLFTCERFFNNLVDLVWVGGEDNFQGNTELYRTGSDGQVWNPAFTGISGIARDLTFLDERKGYAATSTGIFKTINAGANWTQVNGPAGSFNEVTISPNGSAWAVGISGKIFYSPQLSTNWMDVSPSGYEGTNFNALAGVSDQEVYVVGLSGLVLRSADMGDNWPEVVLNVNGESRDLLDIYAIDSDDIWIVGVSGANYYSEGTIEIDNEQLPDSIEADTSIDVFFTTEFNSFVDIFSSPNNGVSWDTLETNYPAITGTYQWAVPDTNSSKFRIRIQSSAEHKKNVEDISKLLAVFTTDAPEIKEATTSLVSEDDQDVTVQAKITSKRGFSSVKLFFRKGGEVEYDSTGMILKGEDLYQGVIRNIVDIEFSKRGIEYYMEAIDNSIKKNQTTLPNANAKQSPNSIQVLVRNDEHTIVPSEPGDEKYQMISIPLDYGDEGGSIRDVLFDDFGGSYDERNWRLFKWKNDKKIEFPSIEGEPWKFEIGRAFWLVGRSDSITTGQALSVTQAQNAILLPDSGWHQVANPFAYRVSASSVNLGPQMSGFYEYLPDSGKYKFPDEVTELIPFRGYFIRSDLANQTLLIPPIESSVALSKKNNQEALKWQITLNFQEQGLSSARLVFGHSSFANDQFDRLDWLDPPSPVKQSIRSYIPHPEWPTFKGNYKRDIRLLKEEGDVWDFIIESNIEGLLKLRFELDSRLTEGVEVILLPKESNFPRDLKTQPDYQYYSFGKNERKEFRLIVGPEVYTEEQLSQIQPTHFALFQNYPNPFNPTTTIRYGLPKAEKVTLKIYNLLGKEVVTLVNDAEKTMGYHVAIWDGRNQHGQPVSSGVYIYRLQTRRFTQAKKMILLQ